MRLLSVEIVNFRVIRKARVEFADLVTGIIGPNGSGKSSIVEAVAWSLYGNRVARSGKDEIRSVFARSSEDCQVALEFSVGQERYRIVRRLAGKAKRPEVVLYRGDKPESVGSTETFHQITRLLGLDWRGFLTSFLARQHELNALADLPPVERREHLAGMLGIERLDKALQKIKEDSRMLRQKADVIQKQVDWRESVSGRVEELGEHILRLEHQRDSSQGAYGAAKDEFKEIEVQHREHQVKQAECSRIEASIKATEKGREHIREQLESLRSREARLIEAQKELAELETSLSDLDPLKKQLEELGEAGKQAALRSDIEVQLDAARQELAITEQRLAVRKTELGSVLEMAGEIPEDVTERHQTARTELEQVRKEWTESKANLRVNQRENSRLRSQIESISKIGPDTVCDRCHRRFGDDLPAIREHLNRELAELTETGEELQEDVEERQKRGEALRIKTDELESLVKRSYELAVKEKSLRNEVDDLQQRRGSASERAEHLAGQARALDGVTFDQDQYDRVSRQVADLEKQSSRPDFWQDPSKANEVMRQLSALKEETESWHELERQVNELVELIDLSLQEGDISLEQEIHSATDRISSQLDRLDLQLLLGGEYDKRDALLAIHAGAGGTESQDWAEMLLRMYMRWAEKRGYTADLWDTSPGEEAGIKSAMLEIKGRYAYGYLRSEHGVHRLVRLSPFNADHARHTSFALTEVLPEVGQTTEVIANPDDLKIETFRSSGPGGQHMQKTSSAVRITHIPTGLVATCQSQRSQYQNKDVALRVLQARLLELELEKKAEERAKLKGEHLSAGWGNQIRSYVLHPYRMVKDHRTGRETGNTTAVLDGDLDEFMEAYLRWQLSKSQ